MLPISFDPILPWLCLALAVGAAPIAIAVSRRRAASTQDRPATRRQIAAILISCVTGLVMALMWGLVLEMCASEVLMRTSHGVGMTDPMSWLGAAAALLSGGSRMAWQGLMLFGPLLFALDALADWRLPSRFISTGLALMVSPIVVVLVVAMVPLDRPPTVLLPAVLLWVGVIGIALTLRRAPQTDARLVYAQPESTQPPSRPAIAMQVVRQPVPITGEVLSEETEISLLPAALAREIDDPMQARVIAMPAPLQLPPAAVRRARRLQKTLAGLPRQHAARG